MSVPVFPDDVSALFVHLSSELITKRAGFLDVLAVEATIPVLTSADESLCAFTESELAAQIALVERIGDSARHTHPPGVDDELVHLLEIEGLEAYDDPVVAHVAALGKEELVRLGGDQRRALVLGKGRNPSTIHRLRTQETRCDRCGA